MKAIGFEGVIFECVRRAPPLLGFGISTPAQVTDAIQSGAAGAISGSATVNIIAKHLDNTPAMLKELGEFVKSMKAGTSKAS